MLPLDLRLQMAGVSTAGPHGWHNRRRHARPTGLVKLLIDNCSGAYSFPLLVVDNNLCALLIDVENQSMSYAKLAGLHPIYGLCKFPALLLVLPFVSLFFFFFSFSLVSRV